MALNFLGLGFSFGAVDTGLGPTLNRINQQFTQLNATLSAVQTQAAAALMPAQLGVQGVADALGGVDAAGASGMEDMFDAVMSKDVEKIPDVTEEMAKLQEASKGIGDAGAEGATGFGRAANAVLGGAGKITGAMGFIGMAVGPVISSFGGLAETIGGAFDAVTPDLAGVSRRISSLANEGINLTNSLEAEAQGLSVSARATGVNMGYVGTSLTRFTGRVTGMAMGLNIGADQAAGAIRAWDEASETLGATGLSSARDVARFTAALGVNADTLRNSTLAMRAQLGMTAEQIGQVTSSLTQMGQSTGDVAGALNTLPQVMELMSRRRALGDTPQQVQEFASDVAAAARGLFMFNEDSDAVRSTSQALAEQLTENRESFQNMFAGSEDQFPQLSTEIAIVTGGIQESFDAMTQGPGQFIEGMGQMVREVRARGGNVDGLLEFMRGRLQQTFGAEQTATMINFWRGMTDQTNEAMAATRSASVDLGDLGRQAHRTGRTLDEVFERAREGARTALRSVARRDVSRFVGETAQRMRDFGNAMRNAGREGGAMGQVVRTLSEASQIGGLALMPRELRSTTIVADEMQRTIMPLIQGFTTWGGILDTVTTYVALFAAEVISTRQEGESWSDAIDRVGQRFADIFIRMVGDAEDFVINLTDSFATFDWDNLFGGEDGEDSAPGALRRVFDRLREVDWGRIWDNIQVGLTKLFKRIRPWLTEKWEEIKTFFREAIQDWWDEIDWAGVFADISAMAAALWGAIEPLLSQLGQDIGQWFSDNWTTILRWAFIGFAAALLGILVLAVVGTFALMMVPMLIAWAAIVGAVLAVWEVLVWGATTLWEEFGDDITGAWDSTWNWLTKKWDEITAWWDGVWNDASATFDDLWNWARTKVSETVAWFRGIWDGVVGWFQKKWAGVTAFWDRFWRGVRAAPGMLWAWIQRKVQEFIGWFTQRFPRTAAALQRTGVLLQSIWNNVTTAIRERVSGLVTAVREFFTRMGERISQVWERVRGAFQAVIGRIQSRWTSFTQGLSAAASAVGTAISGFFTSAGEVISGVWTGITGAVSAAVGGIRGVFSGVFEFLRAGWNSVREIAVGIWTDVSTRITEMSQPLRDLFNERIMGNIRVAGEIFETVWNNVRSVISDVGRTIRTMFDGIGEMGVNAFNRVLEIVERMSGHSINTIVGRDLDLTREEFEATRDSGVEAFGGIFDSVRNLFTSSMNTEVAAGLGEARSAHATLQPLVAPADQEARMARLQHTSNQDLMQEVGMPAWWDAPGGYRATFLQEMRLLREAIEANGAPVVVATAPGARPRSVTHTAGAGIGHNRPAARLSGTTRRRG